MRKRKIYPREHTIQKSGDNKNAGGELTCANSFIFQVYISCCIHKSLIHRRDLKSNFSMLRLLLFISSIHSFSQHDYFSFRHIISYYHVFSCLKTFLIKIMMIKHFESSTTKVFYLDLTTSDMVVLGDSFKLKVVILCLL